MHLPFGRAPIWGSCQRNHRCVTPTTASTCRNVSCEPTFRQRCMNVTGVRIRVTFIPITKGASAKSDPDSRLVGMGPMLGGMVNAAERLKDRIAAKAGGRYEIADVPSSSPSASTTRCAPTIRSSTLFTAVRAAFDPGNVEGARLVRRNDGPFGADTKRPVGRHRRVSGVVVVSALRVWEKPAADVALFDNPFAARSAPEDLMKTTRRFGPTEQTSDGIRLEWL
jgi:hypothetical protein